MRYAGHLEQIFRLNVVNTEVETCQDGNRNYKEDIRLITPKELRQNC